MDKIKINLVSGTSLEKPLVSAFKSNNAIYVVFDNEINGTMGLPIILVSKLDNGKLVKIEDANEWNAIKEILRMIIAGNQVDYVVVDAALPADDVFFMQLTLPVASFDALKNNYRPNVDNAGVTPSTASVAPEIPNQTVGTQVVGPDAPTTEVAMPDAPVMPEVPVDNQGVAPQVSPKVNVAPVENTVAPTAQTDMQMPMPEVNNPVGPGMPAAPSMPEVPVDTPNVAMQPEVANTPVAPMPEMPTPVAEPVMPEPPVDAQVVANVGVDTSVSPEQPVAPASAPITDAMNEVTATPVDFTADKEAFLKACENMFDALVAKFRN